MQKIKSIIGIVACLLLICMVLIVGILAASTASVQVSVSVNYTPSVSANLKVATSDSDSGCYWDGTNSFPTKEASGGVDGNGYVSIANANDEITRIPTKEENYLNCDIFGRVTIYIQIENTSGFAVCSEITLENNDSTSNSTSIKIQSVENVYLEAKPEGESTEANIKIAKVVLSFVKKTTTTTTVSASATLNVDIIRCDGVEGESSSYLPKLLYNVDFSKDESTFKNVISKSATNINLNAYTVAKINFTNEDPNVYTITSTVSTFYLKITNTSESSIYYKVGSGNFTEIEFGKTSGVITINTSTESLTLSSTGA